MPRPPPPPSSGSSRRRREAVDGVDVVKEDEDDIKEEGIESRDDTGEEDE